MTAAEPVMNADHPFPWRLITSAPKDGTEVLLYLPGWKRPVQFGYFIDTTTVEYGVVIRERKYWVVNGGTIIFGDHKDPDPSHWAPRPSPPAAQGAPR